MDEQHRHDAAYATMCSYLGLSARDVAEIGGFSDRFARDILAGRKSFPQDTKVALFQLLKEYWTIIDAMKKEARAGVGVFYIYRTNEQLRASSVGEIWPKVGKAEGGFVGPYRSAAFEVYRWASDATNGPTTPVNLVFAETPQVS
jgi:hypothetical protein